MSSTHKAWWLLLIGGSLAFPLAIIGWPSLSPDLAVLSGLVASIWIAAAALLTAIPAGLYRLIYKRLTSTEFLSMYTAAWVLVAVAWFWLPQSTIDIIMFVMLSMLMEFFPAFVLVLLIGIFAGWLLHKMIQA